MQDSLFMQDGTELFVGDKVVIRLNESLAVGEVEKLDQEDITQCIGMRTGGWFGASGELDRLGWKILRKATEEDVASLPEY